MRRYWMIRVIVGCFVGSIGLSCVGLCAAQADSRSKPPSFIRAFGGTGSDALSQPFGIAVDQSGRVWVVDRAAGQVDEYSADGHLITRFRGHGTGALLDPEGIAVGPGGNIWIADTGHDRIVEFTPHGAKVLAFGSTGRGLGLLRDPIGLAVAPNGNLAVADSGNSRIDIFTRRGAYVAEIHVATPFGVAVSATGDEWVSSPSYAAGNAIYEFSPSRHRIREFGGTQASYGALSDPGGIAVGPHGRVYVAQPDYGFVSVFNPGGGFRTEFGLTSKSALAGEDLAAPQDIAISGRTAYIADSGNGRIVEFSLPASSGAADMSALPLHPASGWGWAELVLALLVGLAAVLTWALSRQRHRGSPSGARSPTAAPAPTAATSPAPSASSGPAASGPAASAAVGPAASAAVGLAAGAASGQAAGPAITRRNLLAGATALTGITVGAGALPASLRRAIAATATRSGPASLADIEHIVILMQENRSFDHYYGAMPGVRGFNDPTAITLSTGRSVFHQPDSAHAQGYLLPFRYDTKITSAQATPGTDHSWPTQHQAWNGGKMDQWVPAKGEYTMGYFTGADIPFHWALAEAFTICDNYHCSVFGPTNPNRLYMWTGMIDPAGRHGGPVIDNTPAYNNVILSWTTYPERLEAAGLSWQVYQEEDNYDDNALAWFTQFGRAGSGSPLYQRGLRKRPARSSTTRNMTGCRRCPGWSRRRRKASTRTTSRPPARVHRAEARCHCVEPAGVGQDRVHTLLRRERWPVRPRAAAHAPARHRSRVRRR